jgi:RNase P/RNase MRP subunit p29
VGGAYVRRFSNVVQYVVETDFNVFNGRIKPGDITKVDGELLLQLGPVALQGGGMVQMRKATEIGPTSAGLFQAADLEAQEGSDGVYVDANAGFTFNITRGVDLVGGVSIPVKGEDLMYFPIEDLHPTRGNTYSGTIEFRY